MFNVVAFQAFLMSSKNRTTTTTTTTMKIKYKTLAMVVLLSKNKVTTKGRNF